MDQITKLPLWKSCIDEMQEKGMIRYGASIKTEFFEQSLKQSRETVEFGFGMSVIRRSLEARGFYITGHGREGKSYLIIRPEDNSKVMERYNDAALDSLHRAVVLGGATDVSGMTNGQRARHEQILERTSTRLALLTRKSIVASHFNSVDIKRIEK